MKRALMDQLIQWKNSKRRKPLIVNGARQVGKTWLLKEFGRTQFENVAYINFDNNKAMTALFNEGFDIQQLLLGLQAEAGVAISEETTLIIFDEIQECPKAITSLKYFCENAPGLCIAAAGSLLGLSIHQGTGFPVGKVTMLDLNPLSFLEFLDAAGKSQIADIVRSGNPSLISAFSGELTAQLRTYYFVGGMPEAVLSFTDSNDLAAAREIQRQILADYRLDVTKHLSANEVEHVLAVWDSIPRHLGKENKRFVFGQIKEGARARDYRSAITWLAQAGLATVVQRVSKPGIPLSAYADEGAFKLFLLDVGLLGAMSGLEPNDVISGNNAFTEFKGSLAEQYVCQQLIAECSLTPYYWSAANSTGEVDFLVQAEGTIYPIEVKAEENLRAKSLAAFHKKYPDTRPLRFSLSSFREESWMRNVPLYALSCRKLWGAQSSSH